MKKVLLSTVAGLAMIGTAHAQGAAPVAGHNGATSDYVGVVDVWGGWNFVSGQSESCTTSAGSTSCSSSDNFHDPNYATVGGSGKVNLPLKGKLSAQVDVDGMAAFTDGDSNTFSNFGGSFQTTVHLSARDDTHLLGIWGTAGQASQASGGTSATFFGAGAEGQYYHGPWTFYGQAGYLNTDANESIDASFGLVDAWFVGAWLRYFCDDNSFLQVGGAYGQGDIGKDRADNLEADFATWMVRYERQMPGANNPWSYFAAYEGAWVEAEGSTGNSTNGTSSERDAVRHGVKIGARMRFNSSTAKHNDRRGATLHGPVFAPELIAYSLGSF